jgi:hypothetical protein
MFKINEWCFDEWEDEELLKEADKGNWNEDDLWANTISWQLEQFVKDNGGSEKWYAFNGRTSYGLENAPNILVDLRDCNDGEKWYPAIKRWREDGMTDADVKLTAARQALGDLHKLESTIERSGPGQYYVHSAVIIWPYFVLGNWYESEICLRTMKNIYEHHGEIAIYVKVNYDQEAENGQPLLFPMFP